MDKVTTTEMTTSLVVFRTVAVSCFLLIAIVIGYLAIHHYNRTQGPISIRPTHVWLGERLCGSTVDVTVAVSNRTEQIVRIVGMDAGCACITANGLPLVVGGGENMDATLSITIPPASERSLLVFAAKFFVDGVGWLKRTWSGKNRRLDGLARGLCSFVPF